MKEEVNAAVNFLTQLVGKNESISSDQVEVFQHNLGLLLMEKFKGHWFPDKPCKGQAYRCIRINGNERKDPILKKAAEMGGLCYESLKLPVELTIWVDPQEVCCRFGEAEGSYCTVASFKNDKENITHNVNVGDSHLSSHSSLIHPQSPDCITVKKQKNQRKMERMRKPVTTRSVMNSQLVKKNLMYKNLMYSHFYDWNSVGVPFSSQYNWPKGYHELRHLRKPNRSAYLSDHHLQKAEK